MQDILTQLRAELEAARTPRDAEGVRVRYLGRKGSITTLGKRTDFGKMSADQRRDFGKQFNELKTVAREEVERAAQAIRERDAAGGSHAAAVQLDRTLPGIGRSMGSLHPITLVQLELEDLFHGLGFAVLSGFEAETEYFNFDALNIPGDHPARDMQDTYWLTNGMLMRTHTSACQVRALKQYGVPLRAVFPGRCFRYETLDASHENTFYQLEGFMVDKEITVAHLVGVMKVLLGGVFHRDVTVRLRPGYFPFVEPGFELDIRCLLCEGRGCATCHTGWLELMPCGLVHPRVLEHGGVDPDQYSGFAFGLGLTRLAMMKFAISDIRLFNSGDIRFLEQFPAAI